MKCEVRLPSLGDDADALASGAVTVWFAEEGDTLEEGDDLLELTTDKAAFVVPSPVAGILLEQCVMEGDVVAVDELLCIFEIENGD